jgi:hypothetical protein
VVKQSEGLQNYNDYFEGCAGSPVEMNLEIGDDSLMWFDSPDPNFAMLLNYGDSYSETLEADSGKVYYISRSTECKSKEVQAYAYPIPTIESVTGDEVCAGQSFWDINVDVEVSSGASGYNFYTDALGSILAEPEMYESGDGEESGLHNSFVMYAEAYAAETYNESGPVPMCVSQRVPVNITVNKVELTSLSSDTTICGHGSVTLHATASEGTIEWWGEEDEDWRLLGTGSSFTTPNLSQTAYYEVIVRSGDEEGGEEEEEEEECYSESQEIVITVNDAPVRSDTIITCGSYTWIDGITYTESDPDIVFYKDNGEECDSLLRLHLTINAIEEVEVTVGSYSVCTGDATDITIASPETGARYTIKDADNNSILAGPFVGAATDIVYSTGALNETKSYKIMVDKTVTNSTDTVTCSDQLGEDITINVGHVQSTSNASICSSYFWNDKTFTLSGTYYDTLVTGSGCDSIAVLNLTILEPTSSIQTVTACDSYIWHGVTYTASTNTPTWTTLNSVGCDSVVTLNLFITHPTTATDVKNACNSYTWINGTTYTASNNTATYTLTNQAGCDSLVTLNLTIKNSTASTDVKAACNSYTWINGTTYTASNNTATYTLTNAAGCDSLVTLNLTINHSTSATDTRTACDPYTWIDGNTYTENNNTATYTLTNAAGCDSLVTLNLTFVNTTASTDVVSACGSYSWIDGNTYTTSNSTATHLLTNAAGCDSLVTLNLTIKNTTASTDVVSACGSYSWIDGNTYTSSNSTATHLLTNAAGCDSLVTLSLTIMDATASTDNVSACGSHTWIDGNTYTSSNSTATHLLTSTSGCDSLVTLNLTITNTTASTDIVSACGSYTWIDGNTYTSSNNTATHTLTSAGCDSLVTLNLTILDATVSTDVVSACGSYAWIDGNTYTSSNTTATHLLTNVAGCDSLVTLSLTIKGATTSTDVISACGGYTWIDGNTYTSSNNIATHLLTNAAGCDSLVTLNLTIKDATTSTDVISSCSSYMWIDGNTYTSSNSIATHLLTNAAGCDSLVTLNLTIMDVTASTNVVSACGSYTWIDGNTYTSSNSTATHLLTSTFGCDSLVTLNLTITNTTESTDVVSACDSYTWIDGNTYTSSNNTATHTLTSAGCDSLVTLNLTILDATASTDVVSACGSYTWIDGNTYTSSNATATHVLTNAAGCDSLVTLNLTIMDATASTDVVSACGSYKWINGNTYTSSNSTATHLMPSTSGCDSLVTLNLTITNTTASTDVVSTCGSYTWIDGNTYTSSNNTATHTLTNDTGCDSLVTLNLTIKQASTSTDVITACEAYTWIDGITYTTSNGTATHTFTNEAGCDSTVTLNLTIYAVDGNVTITGTELIASDSGSEYQWIDCNSETTIPGETNQIFMPTKNGNYSVIVSEGGCSATSECINLTITGFEEIPGGEITAYPNPTSTSFVISSDTEFRDAKVNVFSLNLMGGPPLIELIIHSGKMYSINMEDYASGLYLVEVSQKNITRRIKLIKH